MTQYKLVPVEPTEAMVDAGEEAIDQTGFCDCGNPTGANSLDTYKAMLAAAPVTHQSQSLLSDEEIESIHNSLDVLKVTRWKDVSQWPSLMLKSFARAIESKVRQQDEEVRRDAERYRHIRSKESSLESRQYDQGVLNGHSCYHEVEGIRELKWGHPLDAAVDSAIAKQKGNNHG